MTLPGELRKFELSLARLEVSRRRVDRLFRSGALAAREYDLLYESMFLAAVTQFEDLIERFLIHMIHQGRGPSRRSTALVSAKSKDVIRTLLLQGDDYLQVLPLDRTIRLARSFLTDPVPFEISDDGTRGLLGQSVKIRNAIAHRSPFALSTFRSKVSGVETLPRNRRYPGPFLRQIFRTNPAQTRHELYVSALKTAAQMIAASW
jgi:hypothetical protein